MASPSTDRRFGSLGTLAIKAPCAAASVGPLTLSGEQSVDSVLCVSGNRVLVKNQVSPADNGIYIVDTGTWTRAPDFDNAYDATTGTLVYIIGGSANHNALFEITNPAPITIGTTGLVFALNAIAYGSALTSINGGQMGGFRNLLINANFDYWQRGGVVSGAVSGYMADRWVYAAGGAASLTQTGNPLPGTGPAGSTVAGLSCGNGVSTTLAQCLEAASVIPLRGRLMTFSIYVAANVVQYVTPPALQVRYSNANDSYATAFALGTVVAAQNIVPSLNTTRYSVTFTVPNDAYGLSVAFIGSLGFSPLYYLSGAQLEFGNIATPFEYKHPAIDLMLCQRYYEKSFPPGIAPANGLSTAGALRVAAAQAGANITRVPMMNFKVTKRTAAATMTFYPVIGGAAGQFYDNTAAATCSTSVLTVNGSADSFQGSFTGAAGTALQNSCFTHWTADAEL